MPLQLYRLSAIACGRACAGRQGICWLAGALHCRVTSTRDRPARSAERWLKPLCCLSPDHLQPADPH